MAFGRAGASQLMRDGKLSTERTGQKRKGHHLWCQADTSLEVLAWTGVSFKKKTVSEDDGSSGCPCGKPQGYFPPGSGLNSVSSLPSTLFHCSASAGTSPLR